MSTRLMWGTPKTAAEAVAGDALQRAEVDGYTLTLPGEVGGTAERGPGHRAAMPVVSATRLVYAMGDDDRPPRVVAVAEETFAGRPDVLAAVQEDLQALTGSDDIRSDVRAEPEADQPPVDQTA